MIVRKRSHLRPGLLAAAVLPVLLVMATGCSSSPTKAPARTPGVVHQTPSQGPSSSAPAPAGADLSGTWSGQYSGAYTGTFTLTWRQSGSDLNGNIDLSTSGSATKLDDSAKRSVCPSAGEVPETFMPIEPAAPG